MLHTISYLDIRDTPPRSPLGCSTPSSATSSEYAGVPRTPLSATYNNTAYKTHDGKFLSARRLLSSNPPNPKVTYRAGDWMYVSHLSLERVLFPSIPFIPPPFWLLGCWQRVHATSLRPFQRMSPQCDRPEGPTGRSSSDRIYAFNFGGCPRLAGCPVRSATSFPDGAAAPRSELGIAISESSGDDFLLPLGVPRVEGWELLMDGDEFSGGWISLGDGGCVPWVDGEWKASAVGGVRRICCLAAC